MFDLVTILETFFVLILNEVSSVYGSCTEATVGDFIGVNCFDAPDWYEASEYCENTIGTSLATITSSSDNTNAVNAAISAGIPNDPSGLVWIGLTDEITEGEWLFDDGYTPFGANSYSAWAPNQPDNWIGTGGEDCVHLYLNAFLWNDLVCTSSQVIGFVCNAPIDS